MKKMVVGALIGACAIFGMASSASAQERKIDVSTDTSVGYSFVRFLETGGGSGEKGFGASFSGRATDKVRFVGDFSGHYDSGSKIHMVQGGVRFSGNQNPKVTPWSQILAGFAVFSGGGVNDTDFVFTPEAGADFWGSGSIGGRVSAGFPIARGNSVTTKMFRLFAGIVIK